MKKHLRLLALTLASSMLVAMLAACGGTEASSSAPASEATSEAASSMAASSMAEGSEAPAGEALDPSTVKVAMVCTGAVNDGGWNSVAHEGLMRIEEELGVEVAFAEKVPIAEVPQALRTFANQGYNLIFGHGAEFGEPMTQVAPEFPDVTFVPVNANAEGDNLSGTVFRFGELGYFTGMAAAMVSETGVIGAVAPDDAPNNKADLDTFALGAQSINPDIEFVAAYTGSWDDLPKAQEATSSLISQDADVILAMGDAYAVAVYQACEEAGINAVGWVTDQHEISDTVIVSGLQSVADVYVNTASRYLDGTMEPGFQIYGMADGSQAVSELYGLSDEQVAEIDAAIEAYLAGELEIPTLY